MNKNDPFNRLEGTDTLARIYMQDTPGQTDDSFVVDKKFLKYAQDKLAEFEAKYGEQGKDIHAGYIKKITSSRARKTDD